jgi:hypothetical protein
LTTIRSSSLRRVGDDWRTFATRANRPLHGISAGQAFASAFASEAIVVPLLLVLGAPPWVVAAVATLPTLGSAVQRFVPDLLRRTNGNLRGLTLLAIGLGETRGLVLAAIVALVAVGWLAPTIGILLVILVAAVGQTLGLVSGANLLVWYNAILPDSERRLVGPRIAALTLAISTLLLLTAALAVDLVPPEAVLWAYAAILTVGGAAGFLTLASARRLRSPGRVHVARDRAQGATEPVDFARFRRVAVISALGFGLMPYTSIYVMSVLGLTAGFAIGLSAIGSAASLLAAVVVGTVLTRASSSRILRGSFVARGLAALLFIAAFPGNPIAPALVAIAVAVHWAGSATGTLAQNERLFRLLIGRPVVALQGRYVAQIALASTGGQLATAAVLAVAGPLGYLAFAPTYAASGLARLVAARRTQTSPSWSSQTGVWNIGPGGVVTPVGEVVPAEA